MKSPPLQWRGGRGVRPQKAHIKKSKTLLTAGFAFHYVLLSEKEVAQNLKTRI